MDSREPAIIDLTQIDSDESYEYAGFDDDDDEISIVSAWMPNKRIKTEDYYEEMPTEISDGFLSKDEQITESVAPTSAYTEIQGLPNTMMVVTEGRGVASEIAYCFIDLNTTQCTVSQFADSASYSRIIYAILTARPQVVLVPKAMANCKSKAMVNIRRYLPWLTVAPLERSLFSDSDGNRRLQDLAIPSQVAPLVRIMAKK
ncbi:MutS protein msh4 [Coemansia sp. BCRC 34490]|nr:MutS protein msh4 [Coemansia sp. BCRC 34490]